MIGWLGLLIASAVVFGAIPRNWGALGGIAALVMCVSAMGVLAKLADISLLIVMKDVKDKWRNHE